MIQANRGNRQAGAALSTAFAVGALAGGVAAARLPRLGPAAVVAAGGAGAVGQLASSAAPTMATFGAAVVAAAVAAVVFDTAVAAHLQASSPDALRGRVLGIAGLASAAAGVVGGTALGWLADHVGGRGALALAGAACLVAVAAAAPGVLGRPLRPSTLLRGVPGAPVGAGAPGAATATTTAP